MPKHLMLFAALLVTLVFLPGCPGVSPLVGTWTFTIAGGDYGVTLMANGSATSFAIPPLMSGLLGALSWEQNGTEFLLRQDGGGPSGIYVGRVTDNSSITGGWVLWEGTHTGEGGAWDAVKQ
jgi:hypothetical protein